MGLIWEGNIKMVLQEVGWGQDLDWCDSENGQVAGSWKAEMNFRFL